MKAKTWILEQTQKGPSKFTFTLEGEDLKQFVEEMEKQRYKKEMSFTIILENEELLN